MEDLGFPELPLSFHVLPLELEPVKEPKKVQKPEQVEEDPYAEAFARKADFERPHCDGAPPKPSHLDLVRTTYKTTIPLDEVKKQLEAAFPEVSITCIASAEHPCGTCARLRGCSAKLRLK